MIALDTNVISELMRLKPDPRVVEWADTLERREIAVPMVVAAELFRGLRRLPAGARKHTLENRVALFLDGIDDRRFLAVDARTAVAFGAVMADREHQGRPIADMDGLIAATCLAHGVRLATRNIKHFDEIGLSLVNPWG